MPLDIKFLSLSLKRIQKVLSKTLSSIDIFKLREALMLQASKQVKALLY